jgi:beta-glucosidase
MKRSAKEIMRKPLFGIAILFLSSIAALAQAVESSPEIERRVDKLLGQLTLEEKIDLLGGVDGFYIRAVPKIGLPRLRMADGPFGVRNYGPATTMAGGIALAASWNPALVERAGGEIGRDARARGVHFMLGPGVNIYRAPLNGRNFEYFGEDPFLTSRITVAYIRGMQAQGVSATVKHFMGNNSEYDRHNTDSIIDERTMREIYLPSFEAAVKEAHTGSIMDSYNLTNGQHLTQNGRLNIDVAKQEWGFGGIMMSDWSSTYDAVGIVNGGLDLEMPSGKYFNREAVLPLIRQGKVSAATIDDKVRRILRTAIAFGWLDRDQTDTSISLYNLEGKQVALEAARESMVLLKNEGNVLPLSKSNVKTILLVGPDAYPAVPVGGGSAGVQPFAGVSFLEGLGNYAGGAVDVLYAPGIPSLSEIAAGTRFVTETANGKPGLRVDYFDNEDLKGKPILNRVERHVNFGHDPQRDFPPESKSDRWSGYYVPQNSGSYEFFVQSSAEDGGYYRLYVDDKLVLDDWKTSPQILGQASIELDAKPHKIVLEHHGRPGWLGPRLKLGILRNGSFVSEDAKAMAKRADAVVVAAGFDANSESEAADRTFGLPPGQDELIQAMAAANKKVIVVLTSGGGVDMHSWLDQVAVIVQAWYPGQEGGTALAEILFGDANPSGRLPISIERRWEDNPVHDTYYPDDQNRVVYTEGVFVGYRGYEHAGTKPLFPFGFGLSYTTFSYGNLSVAPAPAADGTVTVGFDLTNGGTRQGAEVAQVYVGASHSHIPRPAKELKGFARVDLKPGETKHVALMLDRRAFSYYDAEAKQWRADPGEYDVLVGPSSARIDLNGKTTLAGKP